MTDKQRSAYQREMDQVHVPKAKADETLRMMLEENRRLRAKENEEGERKKAGRRLPIYAGALAAACLLLAVGLALPRSGGYQFDKVGLNALVVSAAPKGATVTEDGADTVLGTSAEAVFPGWEVANGQTQAYPMGSGTAHESVLTIRKEGQELRATVTDYEPALFSTVQKEQQIAGKKVRLAYNEETQTYAAAYEENGKYCVLTGRMEEKAFLEALKGILEKK